jgi:hypothetical protein
MTISPEVHQLAIPPLVVGNVVEEALSVPLSKVGADAYLLLTDHVDRIVYDIQVIVYR